MPLVRAGLLPEFCWWYLGLFLFILFFALGSGFVSSFCAAFEDILLVALVREGLMIRLSLRHETVLALAQEAEKENKHLPSQQSILLPGTSTQLAPTIQRSRRR
jgi:hypothetical protein